MKFAISPLLLTLALGAPAAIAATEMYRSVMPDGSVRYGESPERGAKSVTSMPWPWRSYRRVRSTAVLGS